LKWSHTFWTTSYAMNVTAHGVLGNSRHFSAQTWPVCSTTVNSAGLSYIPDKGGNFTSRWSKKVRTDQELSHSDGKEKHKIQSFVLKSILLCKQLLWRLFDQKWRVKRKQKFHFPCLNQLRQEIGYLVLIFHFFSLHSIAVYVLNC